MCRTGRLLSGPAAGRPGLDAPSGGVHGPVHHKTGGVSAENPPQRAAGRGRLGGDATIGDAGSVCLGAVAVRADPPGPEVCPGDGLVLAVSGGQRTGG